MSLNFILVDDEKSILENTSNYIKKFIIENDINANIALCTTLPQDALDYSSKKFDQMNVYILDINLEGSVNGLSLGRALRDREPNAYIIFLTAYIQLSMMVFKYRLKAFDFLIKPLHYSDLAECLKALVEDYSKLSNQGLSVNSHFINIKSGYQEHHIPLNNIIFIESFGHKLTVHTTDGKIQCHSALKNIEKSINEMTDTFYRPHKSFLINTRHIKEVSFQGQEVIMSTGDKCPISRNKKFLLKEFLSYKNK